MLINLQSNSILTKQIIVADSVAERSKGMLRYSEAPQDLALIFELPYGGVIPLIHSFGMKFNIDLFFLDKDKKVLLTKRDFRPSRFYLPWPFIFGQAKFLIESASELSLAIADNDGLSWSKKG